MEIVKQNFATHLLNNKLLQSIKEKCEKNKKKN